VLLLAGDEEKLKDRNGHLPFDVDESMLHAAGAKYYEVVQNRGEVLFVPSGWHHQVYNLVSRRCHSARLRHKNEPLTDKFSREKGLISICISL